MSLAPDGRPWGQFGGFQRDGQPFFFDVDGLPFFRDDTGRSRFFGVSGSQAWTFDPAYGRSTGWEQQSRDSLTATNSGPSTSPPSVRSDRKASTATLAGLVIGVILGLICVCMGFALGNVAQDSGGPFRIFGFVIGAAVVAVCVATGHSIDRGGPPTLLEQVGTAYAVYKTYDVAHRHQERRQAKYVVDEQQRRAGDEWWRPPG